VSGLVASGVGHRPIVPGNAALQFLGDCEHSPRPPTTTTHARSRTPGVRPRSHRP
jgi:hypothetical protein